MDNWFEINNLNYIHLRITGELAKKWNCSKLQNLANQLTFLDETSDRTAKYIKSFLSGLWTFTRNAILTKNYVSSI